MQVKAWLMIVKTPSVQENCMLPKQTNSALLKQFQSYVDKVEANSVEQCLKQAERSVTWGGVQQLRKACECRNPIWKVSDLRRVIAYANFAQTVVGFEQDLLPVSVRVEGCKAYALTTVEASLVRSMKGKSMCWVHDADWASDRFHDNGSNLGLCGQWKGLSKFATLCSDLPSSKTTALDALGLRGYPAFDKPGVLHFVQVEPREELLALAEPMVPLLYSIGSHAGARDTSDKNAIGGTVDSDSTIVDEFDVSCWTRAPNFQEGTIPGFTSGLRAEVVIRTFNIKGAITANEVGEAGVRCIPPCMTNDYHNHIRIANDHPAHVIMLRHVEWPDQPMPRALHEVIPIPLVIQCVCRLTAAQLRTCWPSTATGV